MRAVYEAIVIEIVGPPLATRLVHQFGTFTPFLLVAATTLGVGATVLLAMSRYLPFDQAHPSSASV